MKTYIGISVIFKKSFEYQKDTYNGNNLGLGYYSFSVLSLLINMIIYWELKIN